MKKVDLDKKEIRSLENLIMNEIVIVGDLMERARKLLAKSDKERITSIEELQKDEKNLLEDQERLQILFNKITGHTVKW